MTDSKPADVLEIVAAHLDANGYGGLYYSGECACEVGNLAPCGEINGGCEPGYKGACTPDCNHEGSHEDGAWHIGPDKKSECETAEQDDSDHRAIERRSPESLVEP